MSSSTPQFGLQRSKTILLNVGSESKALTLASVMSVRGREISVVRQEQFLKEKAAEAEQIASSQKRSLCPHLSRPQRQCLEAFGYLIFLLVFTMWTCVCTSTHLANV